MNTNSDTIAENLQHIKARIASICSTYKKPVPNIILASKTQPIEALKTAMKYAKGTFGENYVQEAQKKKLLLPQVDFHFIGHLQSNKAELAAEIFEVIHTVDSLKIAQKLQRACRIKGKTLGIFIQVNLEKEPHKHGVHEEHLEKLVNFCKTQENLTLQGLMTLPPATKNPEPSFKKLRQLANKFNLAGCSMGMSHDYEAAIKNGATHIRLGRAVFKERRERYS